MENEYRFFYTLSSENEIKMDKSKLNLLKVVIIYTLTFINFVLLLTNNINLIFFLVIELGFYVNITSSNNLITFIMKIIYSILTSLIYLKYYSNAISLFYLSFNIIFYICLYSKNEKASIQINKRVTFYNYMLIINWCAFIYFYIFLIANFAFGKYLFLDTLISILLIISNLFKYEKYFDTYIVKIISLMLITILWFNILLNNYSYNTCIFLLYNFAILVIEMAEFVFNLKCIKIYKNIYKLEINDKITAKL